MNWLRTLTVVFTGLLYVVVSSTAPAEDKVPWAADLQQASQAANQQNRLLLLHFYSDDCPPCIRVEQQVFSQAEVAQAIAKNYVPLKIHARQMPELAARYQVKSWPTDIFCTPAGLEVYRATTPQTSAVYIKLIDQVALQAGVGAGKQWTSNLQANAQQSTDAATGQAQTFANRVALSAQGYADQAAAKAQGYAGQAQNYAGQAQGYATQAQQGVVGAQQQYQQVAGQVQATAQQAVATTAGAYQDLRGAWQSGGAQGAAPAYAGAAAATTAGYAPDAGQGQAPGCVNCAPSPAAAPQQTNNPWVGQQPAAQQVQAPYPPLPQAPYAPAPQQVAVGPVPGPQPAGHQLVPASQAPAVGLEGYCPVTLIESMKWKKADPQFGAIHRGRTYLFASPVEQQKFLADPDRFSPVLSGCDPVRFAQRGELVEGTRSCGLTFNKQIFLFADEAALKQFEQSPQTYLAPVHQAMSQAAGGPVYR